MNILFLCNQNQNRSRTAEVLFRNRYNTKSAGIYNENPVNESELDWADTIIVMEDSQRKEIGFRFPKIYLKKRIVSLGIPDIYKFNQPKLIQELNEKMKILF